MLLKFKNNFTTASWIAVLIVVCAVEIAALHPAHAASRVALVIGNSDYEHARRLANPINDAKSIANALARLDFDVTLANNVNSNAFTRQLLSFSDKANSSQIALVYYAGHGLEYNGQNYLVPIDARLRADNHVKLECLSLDEVLSAVEGARALKLVILDACRDNPLVNSMKMTRGTRSVGHGLAVVEATQPATLISYAAAAGTTADDGVGEHSPYTEGLLKYLEQPGLEINLLFREVAGFVYKKTNGKQIPFEYGRLPSNSIFLKTAEVQHAIPPHIRLDPCRDAAAHWAEAKVEKSKVIYEEHLRLFGDCAFAALARQKLKTLDVAKTEQETSETEQKTECDRLAASPDDSFRISSVKGVELNQIILPAAEIACKSAVESYPSEPRLQYQYGRTFNRAGNYSEAMKWYRKAADLGYTPAMCGIGSLYSKGQGVSRDYGNALKWYRKAADLENASAMHEIGYLYNMGQGVSQDYNEAMTWYRKAADLGDVNAMNSIGYLYDHGRGLTQDSSEAIKWYRMAAERGHASAMRNIGYLYAHGKGVSKNFREAMTWYRKAVDMGDTLAMNDIAWLYDNGNGTAIKKDAEEAARWMESALRAGNDFSRKQMRFCTTAWSWEFRKELQKRLKDAGVYTGRINGTFINNADAQLAVNAIFNTGLASIN